MRNATLIIQLTFVAHAFSKELTASDTQDSIDKAGDKVIDKLLDRAFKAWPQRGTDLDSATLAKTLAPNGNLHARPQFPVSRSRFLAPRSLVFPGSRAPCTTMALRGMHAIDGFRERTAPVWKAAVLSLAILTGTTFLPLNLQPAIAATEMASVGTCLLSSCQKELAQCILNPKCLTNVICLNTCAGRKDEAECQIRCGDQFENDVVGTFNACAVSQKKCVPQKQDDGSYPIPAQESHVKSFDTAIMNGRWFISAGLNKAFDTFDCQAHFFNSPYPGKFYGKLFWRVNEPDGEFFTKDAVQRFVQDKQDPGHMINHDNEYLHYKDDWWILDYEKDDFVFAYYRGSNDAWDGYGGAFVYTRSPTLRPELIPRLEAAMEKSKTPYKWKDFTTTDNSCKLLVEDETVLREKFARKVVIKEEQLLQEALTAVRSNALENIDRTERGAATSIKAVEKEVEQFVDEVEKEVAVAEQGVEKELKKDAKQLVPSLGEASLPSLSSRLASVSFSGPQGCPKP